MSKREIDGERLDEYHLCTKCGHYEIPNVITSEKNGFTVLKDDGETYVRKIIRGKCVKKDCDGETYPARNFGGMIQLLFRELDNVKTRLHTMEHKENNEEFKYLTPEEETE